MPKILDGKKFSQEIAKRLRGKIAKLKTRPKLVIVQVGNSEESNTYIRNKIKFAEKIGADTLCKKYPKSAKEDEIIRNINKFNRDPSVHGIMVQLPAPRNFDIERVIEAIDPIKDVDGLTATNTKHLFDRKVAQAFVPATTKGILRLLEEHKIKLRGAKVVIVGESALVGRPTMLAMLNSGATVTVCHKDTKKIEQETKLAGILISAVGRPGLVVKRHVSKGQIVVDIGITVTKEKKILGDVDFEKVKNIVKAITPVPGGVGPMTVSSLFENLLEAYKRQR